MTKGEGSASVPTHDYVLVADREYACFVAQRINLFLSQMLQIMVWIFETEFQFVSVPKWITVWHNTTKFIVCSLPRRPRCQRSRRTCYSIQVDSKNRDIKSNPQKSRRRTVASCCVQRRTRPSNHFLCTWCALDCSKCFTSNDHASSSNILQHKVLLQAKILILTKQYTNATSRPISDPAMI